MAWFDHDTIMSLFTTAIAQQTTQYGIAFGLAAWFHAGRVKKEIALQSKHLIEAVNNLASALRQDLTEQSKRISEVELRVRTIESSTKS